MWVRSLKIQPQKHCCIVLNEPCLKVFHAAPRRLLKKLVAIKPKKIQILVLDIFNWKAMETRSRRRDSDADSVTSVSSEPAITRSRSTTPFTLRSQCTRHGSECPEGHGIHFRNRLSPSPKSSSKKSPKKIVIERNGSIRKNLALSLEARYQQDNKLQSLKVPTLLATKSIAHTSDYSSTEEEAGCNKNDISLTPLHTSLKTSPLQRYKLLCYTSLLISSGERTFYFFYYFK